MKSIEQIQSTYEKYFKLLTKYCGEESASSLEKALGERLATSPRGLTKQEGGYPGGLLDFSLLVAKKSKMLSGFSDSTIESLIKVSLLHEIGKVGDDLNDQFLTQDSSWHQEKLGQYYKYNDSCEKMTFVHRTLYFLSKFGFKLNSDEWIAIITSSGFHLEENRFYARDNHELSHLLQFCRSAAERELKASASSSN